MRKLLRFVVQFFGLEIAHVTLAEKLVSVVGASLGIYAVILISFYSTDAQGAAYIVPSLGAGAVLLFAVPHGRLSQPWALFGGNTVAALVGVICYKVIPDQFLAASLAVGLSIAAMHWLNCMHPPGGATALAAVIGGPGVHDLGYGFIVFPILVNTLVLFAFAVLFNAVFPWRRYPYSLMRFTDVASDRQFHVDRKSLEAAMQEMNVLVDVPVEELQKLFRLTLEKRAWGKLHREQIEIGRFYASGRPGAEWSVREVIDETRSSNPQHDIVVYRIVEGSGTRLIDSCTRDQFVAWAAREVKPNRSDSYD